MHAEAEFSGLFDLIFLKFTSNSSSIQVDGEDELKKRQLMELAIINGTYRDCNCECKLGAN